MHFTRLIACMGFTVMPIELLQYIVNSIVNSIVYYMQL